MQQLRKLRRENVICCGYRQTAWHIRFQRRGLFWINLKEKYSFSKIHCGFWTWKLKSCTVPTGIYFILLFIHFFVFLIKKKNLIRRHKKNTSDLFGLWFENSGKSIGITVTANIFTVRQLWLLILYDQMHFKCAMFFPTPAALWRCLNKTYCAYSLLCLFYFLYSYGSFLVVKIIFYLFTSL